MPAVTTSFSVLSCISSVLVLLSFPWYLESPYSTGIYLYMAWTSLGCLNLCVNSIMWCQSMSNIAPIWCDISTKFMTIVGVALPVASTCISRHLCHHTIRCVPRSKTIERRRMLLDLSIGLGVPAVYALLYIVVQRFRFNIFEGYGCVPSAYNTPLAYCIVQAPILAFALVSTIYCFRSLIRFRRFTAEDLSTKPRLSLHGYFRLLCLAATEIILSAAGCIMSIVLSSRGQVTPWVSWGDRLEVVEFPFEVWRADLVHLLNLEEARWTMVARAIVFFALFAFSGESRGCYWHIYKTFSNRFCMGSKTRRCSLASSNISSSSTVLNITAPSSQESVLSTDTRADGVTRLDDWKDAPLDTLRPLSTTTSESMYSTNTDPEIECAHGP